VPIALSDGLDIRVNTAVKEIKYTSRGVSVTAENLKTNESKLTYDGKSSKMHGVTSRSLLITLARIFI
jgi:hypothetical protein